LTDDDPQALEIGLNLFLDNKDNVGSLYKRSVKVRGTDDPEPQKILERLRQLSR
jgi:hypothetical protein